MGAFSRKKKIYVSSSTYNLAGDIKDRIRYLPTIIAGHVITGSTNTISNSIVGSLLNGPAIRLRSFGRWARNSGYNGQIGWSPAKLRTVVDIDEGVVLPNLPAPAGATISIQSAEIDRCEYEYWVDQYLAQNMPERLNQEYTYDFDEEANVIAIYFPNGDSFTFSPANFDIYGDYLYVLYNYSFIGVPGVTTPGTVIEVATAAGLPSTAGWTQYQDLTTSETVTLEKTTTVDVTYSDSTPPEHTVSVTSSSATFPKQNDMWRKETFGGQDPAADQLLTERKEMNQIRSKKIVSTTSTSTVAEDLGGGVTKTTVTTVETETLVDLFTYRIDVTQDTLKGWSTPQVFIYKEGSGNAALDTLFGASTQVSGNFFPFIPVRLKERTLSSSYKPELFNWAKKALKKATKAKLTDVIKELHKNKDVGDIDYAYIMFGVALNTKEEAAKEYIFRFFDYLYNSAHLSLGEASYQAWKAAWQAADVSKTNWLNWRDAQANPSSPLYGTPDPGYTRYPALPGTTMKLQSKALNFDIAISYSSIQEFNGTGLGKPDASPGECWVIKGADDIYDYIYTAGMSSLVSIVVNAAYESSAISVYRQVTADEYVGYTIRGLKHRNTIYKGKGVSISSKDAMNDNDESGFVIPLHEEIFREMSLVNATQSSFANSYLLINCYEVVKQKWYQTGAFKIILIIVVIIISVFTYGAGAGAGAGLLGTAASVGAALGFAGTMAIVVGTIANALAAMMLSKLIMVASTAIFGEKVGLIIGTIASIIALNVGTSMANGGSMATGFSNLTRADNLIKLSMAAGDAYAKYMQASAAGVSSETQRLAEEYEKRSDEVMDMWEKTFGFGDINIDPLNLTSVFRDPIYVPEAPGGFLSRTLMTGDDIATLSLDMLTNFADTTLQTNLPI